MFVRDFVILCICVFVMCCCGVPFSCLFIHVYSYIRKPYISFGYAVCCVFFLLFCLILSFSLLPFPCQKHTLQLDRSNEHTTKKKNNIHSGKRMALLFIVRAQANVAIQHSDSFFFVPFVLMGGALTLYIGYCFVVIGWQTKQTVCGGAYTAYDTFT